MTIVKAKMGLILLFALGIASGKAAPTDLYGDPLPSGAIARLGTVRFRHGGLLGDLLISPDGGTLISSAGRALGSSIVLWDAQSGRLRWRISPSQPSNCAIDLSPDCKLLAVSRFDGKKMRFWDLARRAEVHPFGDDAPEAIRGVFSPNGELLATIDFPQPWAISIWDVRKGKRIRTVEGGGPQALQFRSLAFSPNGKMLAFCRSTGIAVWDLAAGKELYQLDLSTKSPMGCVVFSSDSKLLAAAKKDLWWDQPPTIQLWDMATGLKVGGLLGHEGGIRDLAMSPKSNLLASASMDGTIRFWDLAKQQEIGRASGPLRHFKSLCFSADGSVLASGEANGVLRLWDMPKRAETAASAAAGNSVLWVSFARDGKSLISTNESGIASWEPLTGRLRQSFESKLLFASSSFDLSPDGKMLASVDYRQRHALLWDIAASKMVRRFGGSGQSDVSSLTFSPDGKRVAGGSYKEDIIRIWDTVSGKELQHLKGQNKSSSLAFAPDGATLATASVEANGDYTVRLWKLATGKEIWRKVTRPWTAFDLQFSPDGRLLVLVGGLPGRLNTTGEVRLWEAATGKELRHFEGHRERVGCVAFSCDGRMLATGSQDKTVRLWEVSTGGERQCFQGHQSLITAISFSPDGRLLASASSDTTALVWDLSGRFRDGRFQLRRLSAEELDRSWADLAHTDAARAYRSLISLAGSPQETVAFLKKHLAPVIAVEPKRMAPLLAALDSPQFAERDKAMKELERMGLGVEPALRAALNGKPSLELRRRIEALLEQLASGPRLRFLRALEVLELIATTEARQLLESLTQGTADMWPTQEAKASLKRLAKRRE